MPPSLSHAALPPLPSVLFISWYKFRVFYTQTHTGAAFLSFLLLLGSLFKGIPHEVLMHAT